MTPDINKLLVFVCFLLVSIVYGSSGSEGSLLFSKEGRILQVDYAKQAAQRYGTLHVAAVCKDGVVMFTKRQVESSQTHGRRILRSPSRWAVARPSATKLHDRLAAVVSGFPADCSYILDHLRSVASHHHADFGELVSARKVAQQAASFLYEHTTPSSRGRPLAVNMLLAQAAPCPMVHTVSCSGAMDYQGTGAVLTSWDAASQEEDAEERAELKDILEQLQHMGTKDLTCSEVCARLHGVGDQVEVATITCDGLQLGLSNV